MDLKAEIGQGAIYFFGKIKGTGGADYFVVYTLSRNKKEKIYYWCTTKPLLHGLPSENFALEKCPELKTSEQS